MQFKRLLPNLKQNILLKNYTTFKIGGPAKYFYIAKTKDDLIKAIKLAKEYALPFFILGGGSKLLVADEGYKGLIINFQLAHCSHTAIFNFQNSKIYVEAGMKLSDLIRLCLEKSLTGLEWAAGIPKATIGGAIRGNAGAFGQAMADMVVKVGVFDCLTLKVKQFNNSECKFDYRNSIFKQNPNLVILSAELKLKKDDKEKIKQEIKKVFDYRRSHHPMNFPSAGSIFENPRLRQGFGGQVKSQSAGSLIEQCGLKGKQIGKAQISEKHANFIINLGGAEASDVIQLIELAKQKVKQKFKVELKEEVQYLGF